MRNKTQQWICPIHGRKEKKKQNISRGITQWGNRKDIHFLLKVDNSIGEKKSITWGETQLRWSNHIKNMQNEYDYEFSYAWSMYACMRVMFMLTKQMQKLNWWWNKHHNITEYSASHHWRYTTPRINPDNLCLIKKDNHTNSVSAGGSRLRIQLMMK